MQDLVKPPEGTHTGLESCRVAHRHKGCAQICPPSSGVATLTSSLTSVTVRSAAASEWSLVLGTFDEGLGMGGSKRVRCGTLAGTRSAPLRLRPPPYAALTEGSRHGAVARARKISSPIF